MDGKKREAKNSPITFNNISGLYPSHYIWNIYQKKPAVIEHETTTGFSKLTKLN